jgi:hypothetical protein
LKRCRATVGSHSGVCISMQSPKPGPAVRPGEEHENPHPFHMGHTVLPTS